MSSPRPKPADSSAGSILTMLEGKREMQVCLYKDWNGLFSFGAVGLVFRIPLSDAERQALRKNKELAKTNLDGDLIVQARMMWGRHAIYIHRALGAFRPKFIENRPVTILRDEARFMKKKEFYERVGTVHCTTEELFKIAAEASMQRFVALQFNCRDYVFYFLDALEENEFFHNDYQKEHVASLISDVRSRDLKRTIAIIIAIVFAIVLIAIGFILLWRHLNKPRRPSKVDRVGGKGVA